MSRPSVVRSPAAGPPAGHPPRRRARRAAAHVLAALLAGALAAPAARAQLATLTFDGLTAVDASGVRDAGNCYEEAGYRVTLAGFACGTSETLAAWTPDNDLYYTGSPALHNAQGTSVDFTTLNGRVFSFRSIGLAPFLGQLDEGLTRTVMFTGFRANGSTVTRTVEVAGGEFGTPTVTTPHRFGGFDRLSALRLTVTGPDFATNVQFDNVAVAVTPEPGTVALLGAGLAALGALARRRRTR